MVFSRCGIGTQVGEAAEVNVSLADYKRAESRDLDPTGNTSTIRTQ